MEKLCECGCGLVAPVITKTDKRKGWVKGEQARFLNGHNARSVPKADLPVGAFLVSGETRSASEKVATYEITEADVLAMRDMDDVDAADVYDARVRSLAAGYKRTFIEVGIICYEVANRRLWAKMTNPETGIYFYSIDAWMASSMNESRAMAYAAMKAIGTGVAVDDLREMPRANTQTLATLSSAVQRDPEVIQLAKDHSSDKGFRQAVQRIHPEQHLEPRRAVMAAPVESARRMLDECFECVRWAYEIESREDVLENMAAYFMDGGCEREGFTGLSNRMAYASAIGRDGKAHV